MCPASLPSSCEGDEKVAEGQSLFRLDDEPYPDCARRRSGATRHRAEQDRNAIPNTVIVVLRSSPQITVRGAPSAKEGRAIPSQTAHECEQDRPDVLSRREAWFESQLDLDPARLVFIDEPWTSAKMARVRGRALKGERLRASVLTPPRMQAETRDSRSA